MLWVSGAEEGGGGSNLWRPGGGIAVAGWGWRGGQGRKEVVQGVLEGSDVVCECEAGLMWWGGFRRVAQFVGSKMQDGIEMAIEDMNNGMRAG